jgi:competence protein ComEA
VQRLLVLAIPLVLAASPGIAFATVNVNTAQQSELQSTRGLDRFKAKRIIEYRHQNGPYRSLEDLEKVLGPDTAGKVATQVAFEGDPYVPPPKAERKKGGKDKEAK